MKFEDYLRDDKIVAGVNKKLLLVGDSSIRRVMQSNSVSVSSHYYESLMDLVYDQPKDEYDAAVVGYKDNDTESIEAARYLTSFFRKMPIFIVSISSQDREKILKYEKGSEFKYVPNPETAVNIIFNDSGRENAAVVGAN